MKIKPPEFQDLKELYTEYALHRYDSLRKRQRWHETLYNQTVDLRLEGRAFQNPTHTPDAMLIVDDPADHLAMNKILVDQEPKPGRHGEETKGAKELADKNGRWMQKLVDDCQRQEPYYPREIFHNLAYRGEAFPKLDIYWETIEDPEKNPGPPFEIIVPDSITIYASLNLNHGVPEDLFWERVTTVGHVLDKLDEWNEGKEATLGVGSRKDTDLVYFIEWYKGGWMGYLVADRTQLNTRFWLQAVAYEGELVTENPLGHCPFLRIYSGLGKSSEDGDPAHLAKGILTGIERVLIGKSRSYTEIDTLTSKYSLPIPVLDTVDDYILSTEEKDFDAGAIKRTSANTIRKIEYLNPPPIPTALLNHALEQDRILENFRPAVTRGVPMPGEPASSMVTRLGLAVLKWEPLKRAGWNAVTRLCEMALEVVDVAGKKGLADSIEIGGIKLSSAEVNGYYRADVDIEPGNPEQLRFDIFTALQLWDKIPNPQWIIQKFLHEKDATQFQLDIDTELAWRELMKDPSYRVAFFAGVFEKKKMVEEIARLKELVAKGLLPGQAPTSPPQGGGGKEVVSPPSATPEGAGGSPDLGVISLAGTHQPTADQEMPTVEMK